MALIKCHECGKQVSTDAKVCPSCGATVRSAKNFGAAVFGGLAALALAWYFFGGGMQREASRNLQEINQQVADDTVQQYQIAKRNGTSMDVCVHAGLVSASFLQAKDEANYQRWKQVENSDCAAAGLPVQNVGAPTASSTPANVQALIQREELLNDRCRGGSGDDSKTGEACELRDQLVAQIKAQGWCYGHEPQPMSDRQWERCH